MTSRFWARLSLAMAAVAIPACGGETGQRFEVHPTDGTVALAGKPVAKAIIRFHPTDPAALAVPAGEVATPVMLTTETDDDGKFTMSTYLAKDGVPAGDYVVTVIRGAGGRDIENSDGKLGDSGLRGDSSDSDDENSEDDRPAKRRRNAKPVAVDVYRNRSTTPLKATVKPGDNHFEFEVK